MRRTTSLSASLLALALVLSAFAQDDTIPLFWGAVDEPGAGAWTTDIAVSPQDNRVVLAGGDYGIVISENRGESWQSTSGLRNWEIASFTWHPVNPNIVWAGSMSGPCLSRDGGRTWELRRTGMPEIQPLGYSAPVEKVIFDPVDPNHLLAFGGSSRGWHSPGNPRWGAVWESVDGGGMWTQKATLTKEGSSPAFEALGVNIVDGAFGADFPEIVYAVARDGGFYESTDGGETWTIRKEGLPHQKIERIVVHPKNPDMLWIALSAWRDPVLKTVIPGGVYKSLSGGLAWSPAWEGLSRKEHKDANYASSYRALSLCNAKPNILYTCDTAWDTGVIYSSNDGAINWKPLATKKTVNEEQTEELQQLTQVKTCYPGGLAMHVMEIDPLDPNYVFAGGPEFILRSADGGKTWQDITAKAVGDAWQGRGLSGLVATDIAFDPNRPKRVMLLSQGAGKVWESFDDMQTWHHRISQTWPWGGANDLAFAGQHIYVTTGQFNSNGSIVASTNGGKTWTMQRDAAHGLPPFNRGGQATGIYATSKAPENVWAVFNGRLFHSANAGKKWEIVYNRRGLGWIAGDPRRPTRFYVSGNRNCYVTEDGKTFKAIGGPKVAGKLTCDSAGRLYIAAAGARRPGLYRYADDKWSRILDEPYVSDVAVDPTNPDRVAIATDDDPFHDITNATGVWVSANGGNTWAQAADNLPMLRVSAIEFNPHNPEELLIGTAGRGFFKTSWPKTHQLLALRQYDSTAEDRQYCAIAKEAPPRKPKPIVAASDQPVAEPGLLPDEPIEEIPSPFKNGDMEEGGSMPRYWTSRWIGSPTIEIKRDTDVFHGGEASLSIKGTGKAKGQISQITDVGMIQHVTLEAYAKAEGSAATNIAIQAFDPKWKTLKYFNVVYKRGKFDWRKIKGSTKLPAGTVKIGIAMLIEGDGQAWLDDVKVTVK